MPHGLTHNVKYSQIADEGWIRLLKLSRNGSPLLSSYLIATSIEDAPPFYALSYCWGLRPKEDTVVINESVLHVTPTLKAALRVLNQTKQPVELDPPLDYVWIDQICIDQDNVHERQCQVRQMDAIYGRSVRTIVWLGDDEGDARDAFALSERINDICERELSVPDLLSWPSYEAAGHVKIHEHGLPRHTERQWTQLSHLLSRPWFSRLWVLQEVVLSPLDPIALCGTASCSFDAIAQSCHWLVYRGFVVYNVLPQPALNVSKICQLRMGQCQKSLDLLCYMTLDGFNATDARDKVYGLLGIARSDPEWKALGLDIPVDYSSTTEEVYRNLVRALISAKKSTGILSLKMARCSLLGEAWWQLGREGGWASKSSWTVSLDGPAALRDGPKLLVSPPLRNPDAVSGELIARTALPQASKALPAELDNHSGNMPFLSLKGLFVDRVAHVSNSCHSMAWNFPLATRLRHYLNLALGQYRNAVQWKAFYFLKSLLISAQEPSIFDLWEKAARLGVYKDERTLSEAFLYCTTGGLSADEHTIDLGEMSASMLAFLKQTSTEAKVGYTEYEYAAFKHISDLQFFVTERGRIGTGSPQIRVGDDVCVLFGGEVPYIVRRSGNEWLFVGSSFIHELAEGQAIDAWQAGELEARFITFR